MEAIAAGRVETADRKAAPPIETEVSGGRSFAGADHLAGESAIEGDPEPLRRLAGPRITPRLTSEG